MASAAVTPTTDFDQILDEVDEDEKVIYHELSEEEGSDAPEDYDYDYDYDYDGADTDDKDSDDDGNDRDGDGDDLYDGKDDYDYDCDYDGYNADDTNDCIDSDDAPTTATSQPPRKRVKKTQAETTESKPNPELESGIYRSPSGHNWTTAEPLMLRGPVAKTEHTQAAGPRNLGNASTKIDFLKLFLPDAMLNDILRFTNEQGRWGKGLAWVDIDMVELMTTLGLLYFTGLCKAGHENVRDFWTPGILARPLCQAAISGTRFQEILAMLRFDDRRTRVARWATDKFTAIRDVFEEFVSCCMRYYCPGENVTVDEQLVAFRGRCSFRQCMRNKPARYGIKFWVCTDSDNSYVTNMQPYLGKMNGRREKNLGTRVIKDMVRPLYKTGRNVTTNNFSVTRKLAEDLLAENLTLLGTIKDHRREVPHEFKTKGVKDRAEMTSEFLFDGPLTLVSFLPKKDKNVTLLSSLHHDSNVDPATSKPEIILDYNRTKGGVDTLHQMCSVFNVARITRRWSLVVFFNLMNIAALNAFTLYQMHFPDWHPQSNSRRRDFLRDLAYDLVCPQLHVRAANATHISNTARKALDFLGFQIHYVRQVQGPVGTPLITGRCHLCPPGVNRKKTTKICETCQRFACKAHTDKARPVSNCLNCLGYLGSVS